MHSFTVRHRNKSMTNTVSYRGVPIFRGLAFTIYHIEKHGGHVDIFSADRRDKIIEEHNRQFGTHLHGQGYLYSGYIHGHAGFNPANPPSRTSHCLYSDGSRAYKNRFGRHIAPGGKLPWYELGIDLSDKGKQEDVSHFLHVAHSLGYPFVQPYSSGSERHHVVLTKSPINRLVKSKVISRIRT